MGESMSPASSISVRRRDMLAAIAGSAAASMSGVWTPAEASDVDRLTGLSLSFFGGDDCKKPFDVIPELSYSSLPLGTCTTLIEKTPVPGTKYPMDIPKTFAKATCKGSRVHLSAFAGETCTGMLQDVDFTYGQCTKLPNLGSAKLTWSGGCGKVQ